MSFENPIKIEPKHIYNYNTNIVNNNRIDCVSIEETIDGDIELINSKTVKLRKEEENGTYSNAYENEEIEVISSNLLTSGSCKKQQLTFKYEMDCPDTFLRYPYIAFTYSIHRKGRIEVYHGDTTLIDYKQTHTAKLPSVYYFNVWWALNNESELPNISSYYIQLIPDYYANIGLLKNYNSNFKKTVVCKAMLWGDYAAGSVFSTREFHTTNCLYITIDIYARKTKRETKSYALNSSGQCVLTSEIPNFRAKYPYTYPSNELMQEGATALNKYNNNAREALSKCIANSLLYQFKNGKQTASMTVNCTDYYDMLGNKIIGDGVARKTLEAGDYVIPYIKADEPLAKKKDGTPKKFEITSAEFTYEGLAQKHLKMVEVVE